MIDWLFDFHVLTFFCFLGHTHWTITSLLFSQEDWKHLLLWGIPSVEFLLVHLAKDLKWHFLVLNLCEWVGKLYGDNQVPLSITLRWFMLVIKEPLYSRIVWWFQEDSLQEFQTPWHSVNHLVPSTWKNREVKLHKNVRQEEQTYPSNISQVEDHSCSIPWLHQSRFAFSRSWKLVRVSQPHHMLLQCNETLTFKF